MKIGIDVSMFAYSGSGIATYIYNLVKQLLIIDKKNSYYLFYSSFRRSAKFDYLNDLYKLGANVFDCHLPKRIFSLAWNYCQFFPVEKIIGKVDIFHSSDLLRPPLFPGTKGITTIHDLAWKVFPQLHPGLVITAHDNKMALTIKHNDTIIIDSQQAKTDLLKYYPRIKNKIYRVPLGIDQIYFKKLGLNKIKLVLAKYKINTPYLLYVGSIEPRKNINILIKAFRRVLKIHSDLSLILAGRCSWQSQSTFNLIDQLGLKAKVNLVGLVKDEDLPAIYQGAKLFVYPSSYEGFGLPPLESLASGTRVVAYNCPSLNPNKNCIKKVSLKLLTKDILKGLSSKKKPRVSVLDWSEVAKRTLLIYQKVANSN